MGFNSFFNERLRYAIHGVRSFNRQSPSLGDAFAGVPGELGLPQAVAFRVVIAGYQRELRASVLDEVLRIGRESILNAYRHSGAERIEMEITYRRTELRISVRDNGCGIDPQEPQWEHRRHAGLRGMNERAGRIGARLRILSRASLGTEVELCVPGGIAFKQCGSLSLPNLTRAPAGV